MVINRYTSEELSLLAILLPKTFLDYNEMLLYSRGLSSKLVWNLGYDLILIKEHESFRLDKKHPGGLKEDQLIYEVLDTTLNRIPRYLHAEEQYGIIARWRLEIGK